MMKLQYPAKEGLQLVTDIDDVHSLQVASKILRIADFA